MVQNILEYLTFTSYCIISIIVFSVYLRHSSKIDNWSNRALLITAGGFLMLCAITHLYSTFSDKKNVYLSGACAFISLLAAIASLASVRDFEGYLSMRISTKGLMREQLMINLSEGYDLKGVFLDGMMLEGFTRNPVEKPVPYEGELKNGSILKIGEHSYRVTNLVASVIDLDKSIDEEIGTDGCTLVFGYDATAEIHMAQEGDRINQMRDAMCMSTAHDVRTPLSSLGIIVSCMQSSIDLSADNRKLLDEAYVNIELINLIVTQFMEIGKMSTKPCVPTLSEVDLVSVFERIKKIGDRLVAESVDFEVTVRPEVPVSILSDVEWVWQVLLNLLTNASKYTHSGRVDLVFDYRNDSLHICVKDTGIGIPDKKDIFGKFVTHRNYGHDSHGIGLYSIKMKLDALGGTIKVKDNVDEGTIFDVCIPAKSNMVEHIHFLDQGSSAKICLVVDDTPLIRRTMSRLLQKHDVDTAVNGATGLEMMKSKKYDIVLLDNYMPVMDGVECIKRYRRWESENRPGFRQLIYSVSANQRNVSTLFDGSIPKPIDGSRLSKIIERL